jgi:phosphoglycerate dehydrogenase-like enzyme
MIKAAMVGPESTLEYVYGPERRAKIAELASLSDGVIPSDCLDEHIERLSETEVIFSTWGLHPMSLRQLDQMPSLRVLFYAAGSVQSFAAPILDRGIRVISAWRANAVPVAQFAVAQIILSMKGYFRNLHEYDGSISSFRTSFKGAGLYGETVSLLGAGAVGRLVIEMLKPFDLKLCVYDPFLSSEDASELGVEIVSLQRAFERGYVVSNHLADKPETRGLIDGVLIDSMRQNATFINTGRGQTVHEQEMMAVLKRRKDLTVLLDVTYPEPTGKNSPILALSNVHVSSHIAGAVNDEVHRLADLCIEEFERYLAGQPFKHEVTPEMIVRMA